MQQNKSGWGWIPTLYFAEGLPYFAVTVISVILYKRMGVSNTDIAPYKGGIRFHPSVNVGILKYLAFEQTFKNSLTTLPMGGAKGGSDFDPDSITREKLDFIMELKNVRRGRIKEYADKYGCKYVADAKPWGEKGDIALPSATQNEINGEHAKTLVANGVIAVSEGANMPSTPAAIHTFQEAKILYAPGKASNAGGVSVSGLEMSQNSGKINWSSAKVDEMLHEIMYNIHQACVKYGTREDGYIDYVKGANVAGFLKVAKAMMAQGIV